MLKKISSLVLALAVVVTSIAIMPLVIRAEVLKTEYYDYDVNYDDECDYDYVIENSEAKIKKYYGEETNLIIPSTLEGIKVTIIGYKAFDGEPIESVLIPSTITEIGYNAFSNTKLKSVTIPENVTKIRQDAFSDCQLLETVNYNPINCSSSIYGTFNNCDNIKTINIGPKVTVISDGLFGWVPVESVIIPNSVKKIRCNAFIGSGLKSVTIPETVTNIGTDAFSNCKLLETINFNAIKCSVGIDGIFRNCDNIKTINIGPKVTIIPMYLFKDVPVEKIAISSSVQKIGYCAFADSSIKSIYLPEGLTFIGAEAFSGCNDLKDVYYAGTKQTWENIEIESGNDRLQKATIHFGKITVSSPKITKATKKKKSKKLSIKFSKVSGALNYEVQVSESKKFKKILAKKTLKKTSTSISSSKLKKKKKLYVRVRCCKKYNGKVFYSKWSKVYKAKIK